MKERTVVMSKNGPSKADFEAALKHLGGFARLGADVQYKDCIPTGHFNLDFAIHFGRDPSTIDLTELEGYDPKKSLGLPLGKIVEFFGEEGSGKSSLAYRVAGFAQRKGYKVMWIDTEHSFSPALADINGCDRRFMIYADMINRKDPSKPFHAEDVIDNIVKACQANVDVVILDSVANLVPQKRMESSAEQKLMGTLAHLLGDNIGKIATYADSFQTLVLLINQLREKMNQTYGDRDTSPGGHSLKHNDSLKMKLTRQKSTEADIYIQDEDGEDVLIGGKSYVRLVKNRFGKPYRGDPILIPIYYEPYFPGIEEIAFDFGRQIKLITVREKVFKWGDVKVTGRRAFIDHLKEKSMILNLVEDIKGKAKESNTVMPPEMYQFDADEYKKSLARKPKDAKEDDVKDAVKEDEKKDADNVSGKVHRGRKGKDNSPGNEDLEI